MSTEEIMQIFAEKYSEINTDKFYHILNYQSIDMHCAEVVLAGILTINEIKTKEETK